ncbi:MAG: hypothetical protein IKN00_04365 [Bacteroidales bacterium]|nr:hypothetical protein [Bacteroidales bacterium]
MKVKDLKAALEGCPDEADVFYDTLDTEFFQQLMGIFGSAMPYPDGTVADVQVTDIEPVCDCIVWLKEHR